MSIERRVSTEALSEIFLLLCLEPIALHELNNISYFYTFPWAAGQVCRRWRSVFLSYPALWSSLSLWDRQHDFLIMRRTPSDAYVAEMKRRTAIYLKRSKGEPLTVTVDLGDSGPVVKSCTAVVWSMLLSCSDRWERADLRLSNWSLMDDLVKRRRKMLILKSLRICMEECEGQNDLDAFKIAPNLTELKLVQEQEMRKGTLGRWRFPWAQLTNLCINVCCLDFPDSNALRTFLLQLQNLEELLFYISDVKREFGIFKCPAVRFARLRHLVVSLVSPEIFSWFEAPLLEHLRVYYEPCSHNSDHYNEELSSLVNRSSCHIRHLTLQNCEVEAAHNIMKVLTSVETLCIRTLVIGPTYYPRLVRDIAKSDGIYMPNLRVLQVPCCPRHFEELALAAFRLFKARNLQSSAIPGGVVPLEKLMVSVDRSGSSCCCCRDFDKQSRAIDKALKVMCSWPSFSVTTLHNDPLCLTLNVCALMPGALANLNIDLFIHYPRDPKYYSTESRRHYNVLDRKRLPVDS